MDFETSVKYEINKSRKLKNATRLFYYQEALDSPYIFAIAGFETFRGSWAFDGWFAARKDKILAFVDEQRRRFFINWTY